MNLKSKIEIPSLKDFRKNLIKKKLIKNHQKKLRTCIDHLQNN